MKKFHFILMLLLAATGCRPADSSFDVVPKINGLTYLEQDGFIVKKSSTIVYPGGNPALERTAKLLGEWLGVSGIEAIGDSTADFKGAIVLDTALVSDNREAYELKVDSDRVLISGASSAGVFYGAQTLRKAVAAADCPVKLPAVEISDAPRFGYRGALLDVARHFFPVDFIKSYIDILALHNINTLHWHLTDDQGWRVEIKRYPELTEVGSIREETLVNHYRDTHRVFDGKPYGGFYTQDEIREVVNYASSRFITIIPEIDLPGHMMAALTCYPELGCTGGPYKVRTTWGVEPDVLCAGNEKVFEFIEGVLTEIMEMFPSEYIHIGGDECPKDRWEACPKCQAKIRELKLRDGGGYSAEMKLQSYVMDRVGRFLMSHGRSFIGWDEILEGGLAKGATVMSWRGMEGGIAAAKQGHDAIIVPYQYLYLDYSQAETQENEPLAIGVGCTLEKVYSFDPTPAEDLTPEEVRHILGVQANLWTEYISTPELVEYMLLPRLGAVSEIQWTESEGRDYDDFLVRLKRLVKIYDDFGYSYGKHAL